MFKLLSPFYTDGRRFLRLSVRQIDRYLAARAQARFNAGLVTFTMPDGREIYTQVRLAGKRRAAAWVNRFNQRVGAA